MAVVTAVVVCAIAGGVGVASAGIFSSVAVLERSKRKKAERRAERAEQQLDTKPRPTPTTRKYSEFDVTDESDPPEPSIWYDYYGGQFSEIECMIIGSFGEELPRGIKVERRCSAVAQRSTRGTSFLPGVREDAERIQEIIRNDPKKILSYVFLDFPGEKTLRSKDEYLEKIKTFLVDCKKHGAMIWYAGHGEKGTGNWCFRDGKITFEDILNLYGKYFFGRLLYIITDCCYSGSWVDKLAKKMDEMGIGACGHEAKKRGFFLKIAASCRSDQKAYDALYTKEAVSVGDDGIMQFSHGKKLHTTQTTMFLDTTSMRCFHGPSRECLLHNLEPAQHWTWADLVTPEKISRLHDRFKIVRGLVSGLRVWRIVFVHDNLYDQFMQIIESGSVDVTRYAHILASGAGNDPPEDMLELMTSYRPNH